MRVVGHCCYGMLELPENTRISVTESIRLGLNSIEFDVRSTKDNIFCVIHGQFENVANGLSDIESMTYEQCKTYITQTISESILKNKDNF